MWASEYALALELFALGRVFLFKVAFESEFPLALVPFRTREAPVSEVPFRRVVFNPELGRGVSEMLARAVVCGTRREWTRAEEWCAAAAQVEALGAMYRGTVNIALASAVVQFYSSVVCVGKKEFTRACELFEACAKELAFTSPDRAAAAWLAVARLCCFQNNPAGALWALQKCEGLMQDLASPALEILIPLVAAEYTRVCGSCNE